MTEINEHQARVVREFAELVTKIEKLRTFLFSDTFSNLPPVEQGLLLGQLNAMHNYADALNDRLLFWGVDFE